MPNDGKRCFIRPFTVLSNSSQFSLPNELSSNLNATLEGKAKFEEVCATIAQERWRLWKNGISPSNDRIATLPNGGPASLYDGHLGNYPLKSSGKLQELTQFLHGLVYSQVAFCFFSFPFCMAINLLKLNSAKHLKKRFRMHLEATKP